MRRGISPALIWRTPGDRAERLERRTDRARRKARGQATPRLRMVALVELDAIEVPAWARRKAVPGLTVTETSVWLGRIAARMLEREDQRAGGSPRLTMTGYRPCRLCGRARLGADAEYRLELDRQYGGASMPCGPECSELQAARKARRGAA